MISAKFGHILDQPLAPLVQRLNLSPNHLTLTGFFITVMTAVAIPHHLVGSTFFKLLRIIFTIII
jgi:hypothetical protein